MKCSFCKTDIPRGTGTMFIKNSGKVFWFCKKKCEKNMFKLKRNPTNLKWSSKEKITKK